MDETDDAAARAAYREKLRSIGFNFVGGGGYGRKAFSERTTAEVQREMAKNPDAEPVGKRWV